LILVDHLETLIKLSVEGAQFCFSFEEGCETVPPYIMINLACFNINPGIRSRQLAKKCIQRLDISYRGFGQIL
jgi:hypothetical protein